MNFNNNYLKFTRYGFAAVIILAVLHPIAAAGPTLVRIAGHVPAGHIAASQMMGRLDSSQTMTLSVSLNLRNQDQLTDFIDNHLYNPKDPQFGQYLTPAQFAAAYLPTDQDIQQVSDYLTGEGLTVTSRTGNLIKFRGAAKQVETAFNLQMNQYMTADARVVFAPNAEPEVTSDVASKISGIIGLSNFASYRTHIHKPAVKSDFGSGPAGGLAPADIVKAYNVTGTGLTGTGQTLGLFELDGYTASDITGYTKQFGINTPPTLQNILIDDFSGMPSNTDGPVEVTVDIELMMAVAPGASKILVYEGPNSDAGVVDTYTKIANDNLAPQVSTSWGLDEPDSLAVTVKAENTVFMQMAAQGQTIYAASGDSGAFDGGGKTLAVDDPASQPYVTGAGGTTLTLNADGTYGSESSWGVAGVSQGGGGGISAIWPIPTYQTGLATAGNLGSNTMRMVPDISLDANPNTGYSFFFGGAFSEVGGTSCAAPLWAAFTALINEQRATTKTANLGFANPTIYQLAASSLYGTEFHDIKDMTTNLFYPATVGYDLSTGWGTFNATTMLPSLANPVLPPFAPMGVTGAPHNTVVNLTWSLAKTATTYAVYRGPAAAGPFTALNSTLTSTAFVDTGLTNGSTYYYYVTAVDASGASGNSATVSVTPTLVIPQAPTNLTAAPVLPSPSPSPSPNSSPSPSPSP